MMTGEGLLLRRIIVAMDASNHSFSALEAGVVLAENLDVELLGIYVEDTNLLNLAGLPSARELLLSSATELAIDSRSMERSLRLHASRAEEALREATLHRQVRSQFQVVRGHIADTLVASTLDEDLLILSHGRPHPGNVAIRVARRASRSVMLVRHGVPCRSPVMLVYDGSHSALKALQVAARLASGNGLELLILVPARDSRASHQLQQEASEHLPSANLMITYSVIPNPELDTLMSVVHEQGGGLLVLYGDEVFMNEQQLETFLNQLDCPVLLVK